MCVCGRVHIHVRTRVRFFFLDASSHFYKMVCPSVGPSVGLYVCNAFVKNAQN